MNRLQYKQNCKKISPYLADYLGRELELIEDKELDFILKFDTRNSFSEFVKILRVMHNNEEINSSMFRQIQQFCSSQYFSKSKTPKELLIPTFYYLTVYKARFYRRQTWFMPTAETSAIFNTAYIVYEHKIPHFFKRYLAFLLKSRLKGLAENTRYYKYHTWGMTSVTTSANQNYLVCITETISALLYLNMVCDQEIKPILQKVEIKGSLLNKEPLLELLAEQDLRTLGFLKEVSDYFSSNGLKEKSIKLLVDFINFV